MLLERNEWKLLIKILNIYMCKHNILFNGNPKDLRPDWNGMYAYGAKAYPIMDKHKRGKIKKYFKSNTRTYIDYLVGYQAINIYRVWVPKLREILTTQDVTFKEDKFFNLNTEETSILIAEYRSAAEMLRISDFKPFDSSFRVILEDNFEPNELNKSDKQIPEEESQRSGGEKEDRTEVQL
jgi:hypothetical protein